MHDDIESCVVFGLKDRNLLTSFQASLLSFSLFGKAHHGVVLDTTSEGPHSLFVRIVTRFVQIVTKYLTIVTFYISFAF